MECVRGHANIEININDILNGDLKSQDMRLVFKNNCKSDIVVSMNVTEPFKVVSLRSRISGNFKSNNEIQAPVLINGYLEVYQQIFHQRILLILFCVSRLRLNVK